MSRYVEVGVFASEDSLLGAARACRARRLDIVDVLSPYPVHGLDEIAGIRCTRLPAACLAGGAAGPVLALWLQYWTSAVDWPLNVGGKPWDSLPAFLPVAFELTVLFAGLSTVAALLLRCRLRPGRAQRLAALGATDDRFVLLVARPVGTVSRREIADLLSGHGAERTFALDESGDGKGGAEVRR